MDKQTLLKEHPEVAKDLIFDAFKEYIDGGNTAMAVIVDNLINSAIVPDKKWEITALKGNFTNKIYTKADNLDVYTAYDGDFTDLDLGAHSIHSVKRLSDGEVFTVGDKVDFHISRSQQIKSFSIMPNGAIHAESKISHDNITSLKKISPLFTTEDGVDVYDGDTYYYTNNEFKISEVVADINQLTGRGATGSFKDFSTKEAAESYILMNKPVLSVEEVSACLIKPEDFDSENVMKFIRELAKSKI